MSGIWAWAFYFISVYPMERFMYVLGLVRINLGDFFFFMGSVGYGHCAIDRKSVV